MILDKFRPTFSALLKRPDPSRHDLVGWLFLRGLALIYAAAFASMAGQIRGLIGQNGILPIQARLAEVAAIIPDEKYTLFPTLFWLDASDQSIGLVCHLGLATAILLLLGLLERFSLIACYLLYLSVTVAGQDFTSFQWDIFLLETGFLAILLPWGSEIIVFLYRWLIARFMFMGGVVKIASGDPTWANLTALDYHYLTEPLPSPLAYYAYYLPHWFNALCVALVLVIELVVPFFVFLPRRFRLVATWSFIVLQTGIILTGNYNFFNFLTILLCLFLFDDQDVEKLLPRRIVAYVRSNRPATGVVANGFAATWLCVVMLTCATHIWIYHAKAKPVWPLDALVRFTSSWSLINNYGPFAVMTTERNEIIVQGSYDGQEWLTYPFKYKPVARDQPLKWNIPHQPRLDWQMWFAALGTPANSPWFESFMLKLQAGSPDVLALLAGNPFLEKPPNEVRAVLYRYRYTTPAQRGKTGHIWQREFLGLYWPMYRVDEIDVEVGP